MPISHAFFILIILFTCHRCSAEPNGAVLYRNGQRFGTHTVSSTAEHHYFGYLEGPAWENKYCAFRYYIDKDDRNALDIIGKKKEKPILHYFKDPSVDEHTDWPWGTDILKVGSSMGLGSFRLYIDNKWVNPQLPENCDSLVVTIKDSSVQTPTIEIIYYGWQLPDNNKITVTWTITTTLNDRATHCKLAINGTYPNKVVIGMVNHKDNNANPNRRTISLIQDETPPLLATLGKQCGLQEGFDDTCLMAIFAEKEYFSTFTTDGTNYGMVLSADDTNTFKWSFAYSWAREPAPLFRNPDWKKELRTSTNIHFTR